MARPGFSSSRKAPKRSSRQCATRSRSARSRTPGVPYSSPGWRATLAGVQPRVATRISTGVSPARCRRDRRGGPPRLAFPVAQSRKKHRVLLAADGPAAVPQIEPGARAHRVLLRGGERTQRADVAPVRPLLVVLHARNLVGGKIVGIDAGRTCEARQHVAPEIDVAETSRFLEHP